jgi:excisionase family DNA binding protein
MKLLNIEEVAEDLGVSRQTVARMIAEGSLPAICLRSGRKKKVWRIRPEALERWLKERETPPRGHSAKKIA